jgi:hypothetical protein
MKASRVVVVAWAGGVRAADSLLDPRHRQVPRLWEEMVPRGTLLTRLYNDGWTNHGPSVKALATGRWEVEEYNHPRPSARPTLVEAARGQGRSTLVVGRERHAPVRLLDREAPHVVGAALSADPAPFGPEEPGAALYPLRSFDRPVVAAFLAREGSWPDLSFLVLDDTDMAHQRRWSWYTGAIRQADALVHLLWRRLPPETDLVVLPVMGRADHGQTRWGFMGHGREDEGCARLWMLGLGPDFPAGRVVERRARLIDVAPTIAHLLGLAFRSRGRVLQEALA